MCEVSHNLLGGAPLEKMIFALAFLLAQVPAVVVASASAMNQGDPNDEVGSMSPLFAVVVTIVSITLLALCAKKKALADDSFGELPNVVTGADGTRSQTWSADNHSETNTNYKKTKRARPNTTLVTSERDSLPMMVNPMATSEHAFGDQWSFTKSTKHNPIRQDSVETNSMASQDPTSQESVNGFIAYSGNDSSKRNTDYKVTKRRNMSTESDTSVISQTIRRKENPPPLTLALPEPQEKDRVNIKEPYTEASAIDSIVDADGYVDPVNHNGAESRTISPREAQDFLGGSGKHARPESANIAPIEVKNIIGTQEYNSAIGSSGDYADAQARPMSGLHQYVNVEERLMMGDKYDAAAAAAMNKSKPSTSTLTVPESHPASPTSPGHKVFNTFALAKTMTTKEFTEFLFYKNRPGSGRKDKLVRTPSNRREELDKTVSEEIPILKNENITRNSVAGEGSFGTVYRGLLSDEGFELTVAIKELKEGIDEKAQIHFLQEAYLLAQLCHRNIIAMIGGVFREMPQSIVMELCEDSLLHRVRTVEHTPAQKVNMCLDVARGCAYLFEVKFVHRDLAARNVLVDKEGSCKIADFGLACPLAHDKDYYKSSGGKIPLRWCAPECINFRKYSTWSDVWAFGIVMWEVFSDGDIPYLGIPNTVIARGITEGMRLKPPIGCLDRVHALCKRCWAEEPLMRIPFPILSAELESILTEQDFTVVQRGTTAEARSRAADPQSDDNPYETPQGLGTVDTTSSSLSGYGFSVEMPTVASPPNSEDVPPPIPEREAPPPPLRRRARVD